MKWQLLIFFFITNINLFSQCGLNKTINIIDLENELPDTTNVSLLVSGALQNNLASPTQGLCGIQLKFKHPFVKELFIELISPSGQKIQMVGGNIVAYNTPLVTWDVTFVPCGSASSPDAGFSDVWENDQDWLNLTTYTGAYYPHQGCLEDFNMGSVNGTWTIRCIDNEDFGMGRLQSFNLIFCDGTGISCGECKLDPGAIINADADFCQGDTSLNLTIVKNFPKFPINDTIYKYKNVVFKDTILHQYAMSNDFTSYASGTYQICGLQYAKLDESKLPIVGTTYSQESLKDYFFTRGMCADVSDSCMTIIIHDQIPVESRVEYLCLGDTLVLGNNKYYNAGFYNTFVPGIVCDTIVNLEIKILSLNASISASIDTLSCVNKKSILTASHTMDNSFTFQYQWYTGDGMIDSDSSKSNVNIIGAGTYCLGLTGMSNGKTCIDTICKEIVYDGSNPVLNLTSDTITCTNDTVLIKTDFLDAEFTLDWSSTEGNNFIQISSGIKVWISGSYTLSVSSQAGCNASESIFVASDLGFPDPSFKVDTITCIKDSVQIVLTPEVNNTFSYQWTNVEPIYQNAQNPYVKFKATYLLQMQELSSGCIQNYAVDVVDDIVKPKFTQLLVDTINCINNFATPVVNTDQLISNYNWQGPSFSSNLRNPVLSFGGQFFITITSDRNGCKADSSIFLVVDTLLPNITIMVDSISCLIDSIKIKVNSSSTINYPKWTGPNVFEITVLEPFIKDKGLYHLEYVANNGCIGSQEIEVFNSTDVPFVSYDFDSITCAKDTILMRQIAANGTYTFSWTGPGLLETNISEPRITKAGTYILTLTNISNGCNGVFEYEVYDKRIYSIPQLTVAPLTCAKDSTQIILANTEVQSVTYQGPSFSSTQFSPFVRDTGWYYLALTNTSQCTSYDSIKVIRNDTFPIIAFLNPAIGCGVDSISMTGFSNILGTSFQWLGPNGFNKMGSSVYTSVGGNYSLIGTAPNNCKTNKTVDILYDTIKPQFNILLPDTLTCKKTFVELTTSFDPSKGSLQWFPSGLITNTLSVDQPGIYTILVTGLNGCSATDSIDVFEKKILPTFSATSTIINCKDVTSNVVISPISNFKSIVWKNSQNPTSIPPGILNFSTSFPGIFYFSFENNESCIADGSIEVKTDISKPEILGLVKDTLNCLKSSVDIGVVLDRDGIEFLWNGPSVNDVKTDSLLSVTLPGQYYVLVTGTNFCKKDTFINVEKIEVLPQFVTFTDTLTCAKDSVIIGVNQSAQNISYQWQGPGLNSNSRTPIIKMAGIYTVTVTNSFGCSGTAQVEVIIDGDKPSITSANSYTLFCDSTKIKLVATSTSDISKYTWTFPNGMNNLMVSPETNIPGKYTVQLTGENGCLSDKLDIEIAYGFVNSGLFITADSLNCITPKTIIKANGPIANLSFNWKKPSGDSAMNSSFETSEGGLYTLIVQNDFKCADTLTYFINQDTIKPILVVEQIGEIQCDVKKIILDANQSSKSPNIQANWSTTNGHFITNNLKSYIVELDSAGTYFLQLENMKSGCKSEQSIEIKITPQRFTEIISIQNDPSCAESRDGIIEILSLNGFPDYIISINGSNVGNQQKFANLSSGQYVLDIIDRFGCKLSKTILLNANIGTNISLEKEVLILFGDSILLKPEFLITHHTDVLLEWYKGSTLLCSDCPEIWVRPFVNSVYTLKYSVNGKCKQSFNILVKVKNFIQEAVPNIFAPSSTSGNNLFFIPQIRGIEKINYIKVFDRWAENVYYQKDLLPGDPSFGWDGRFNGKDSETGVYVVLAQFVLSDGKIWDYNGSLTLVR